LGAIILCGSQDEMIMSNPEQKFDLTKKADLPLSIYLFTVQDAQMRAAFLMDFRAVIAYTPVDAITMIRKEYPEGVPIAIDIKGSVPVQRLMDFVNIPRAEPITIPTIPLEPMPEMEKTVQQFIEGLMLVMDKFVTDKKDRAMLKKIISKIKNDESAH
jgi:hypothetical protein